MRKVYLPALLVCLAAGIVQAQDFGASRYSTASQEQGFVLRDEAATWGLKGGFGTSWIDFTSGYEPGQGEAWKQTNHFHPSAQLGVYADWRLGQPWLHLHTSASYRLGGFTQLTTHDLEQPEGARQARYFSRIFTHSAVADALLKPGLPFGRLKPYLLAGLRAGYLAGTSAGHYYQVQITDPARHPMVLDQEIKYLEGSVPELPAKQMNRWQGAGVAGIGIQLRDLLLEVEYTLPFEPLAKSVNAPFYFRNAKNHAIMVNVGVRLGGVAVTRVRE